MVFSRHTRGLDLAPRDRVFEYPKMQGTRMRVALWWQTSVPHPYMQDKSFEHETWLYL